MRKLGQQLGGRIHVNLVMHGTEVLGDQVRVLELVPPLLAHRLEADREGIQPALSLLGQQADDEARVQPPREQHADVHVRHQAALDRTTERLEHLVLPVLEAEPALALGRLEARLPVGALALCPIRLNDPDGRGRELAHAA